MTSNQIVMSFHSDAVKDDTLLVAAAEGVEALAQPFRFDLDLVSADPGLDLSAILRVNARLSLNRTMDLGDGRSGDIAYDYHGILTEFRQLGRVGNSRYRYRAVLRPHLWKLACTRRSRIYTDKSVPDLLRAVLDEAGIAFTFKFADEKSYPINPYVVQYEETDLDFISRWMEHVGISYYYDAKGDLGTLVVIDNARGYVPINPYDERVVFDDQAAAGVWSSGRHQRIRNLEVEETRLPKRVQLKEYNYEAPSNELKYDIEVDAKGFGTWYEYNSNYRTESEAKFLLAVRKGFWLGQRRRLHGQADHRSFQPGRTFTLTEHFNPNISDVSYALIEVRHHLSQAGGNDVGTTGEYTCDFIAMPADLPHRPERVTAWPSIHGVVNARIAGGALGYAELDEMGRYKVDVDYDLNDQTIGKVRMAQPSVGENAGMHFPLRKHTEVLLGHIDGDPDKPVILGAVHDAEKTNLLDKNIDPLGMNSSLKSQGGNVIHMNDGGNQQHMIIANGSMTSFQRLGNPQNIRGPSEEAPAAQHAAASRSLPPMRSMPPASQVVSKSGKPQAPVLNHSKRDASSSQFASTKADGLSGNAVTDTTTTSFWTSLNDDHWTDFGSKEDLTSYPAKTKIMDWQSHAAAEFTAMNRTVELNPGTDYKIPDYSTLDSAITSIKSDLKKMNIIDDNANDDNDCLGQLNNLKAPGLNDIKSVDPDTHFANFIATVGGTQRLNVGDEMAIHHGNKWNYQRGDNYDYVIGDCYHFGMAGNDYHYDWNDLTVNFCRGKNEEISYMEEKKEWSNNEGNEDVFKKIDKNKTEKLYVGEDLTIEERIVGERKIRTYAKTRNEYDSFEYSGRLQFSWVRTELSAGAILASVNLNGLNLVANIGGIVEINAGLKVEVDTGGHCAFKPFGVKELTTSSQKATADKIEAAALSKTMNALCIVDIATELINVKAKLAKNEVGLEKLGFKLSKTNLALSDVQAIFL